MVAFDSLDALRAFVGQSVTSEAIVIDQPTINGFADVTGDHQWIHVDPVRAAAESPYKTTIAHGFLTLSLLPASYNTCFSFPNRKMAVNYGLDRVRFTGPVPSGSPVRGSFTLEKVDDLGPGEARCTWKAEVRVVGAERPALVALWLVQIRY
ncbi:MaoC family dehydratase [Ramlibacter sp. H39-3-26]|uniref:MaoC family dehydratase n=1 Tax=Curvibacter soli TaxID=3031331 RepID=UPI0023DBE2A1|nr:MaoC family dehydratase [Ramlibacter sp. H39-3-26]MDF1485632.1 MaoC family dehydratase [Ramlibacter sp. H39-3-26]